MSLGRSLGMSLGAGLGAGLGRRAVPCAQEGRPVGMSLGAGLGRSLALVLLLAAACLGCGREATTPTASSPAPSGRAAATTSSATPAQATPPAATPAPIAPTPASSAPAAPASATLPHPTGQGRSILLVTIDTWRTDALGASGSGRVATPRLDALATGGVYIRKVQTSCPLTTPAHATILTGLVPHRHGVRDNMHYRLNAGVETLASLLSRAGYQSAAIVSGAPLRKLYGLDRGFASYNDSGLLAEGGEAFVPSHLPANQTTDRALAAVESLRAGPAFVWVHYYDPHFPYAPPAPFRTTYAADPYMGEVAFVDAQLGRLLDGLPREGGREWTVVVTGDHGEALGEHGEETHGVALYEGTLQVPLLIHPRPDGFRDPAPGAHVGLVDLLPTICHLANVKAPPCDGADLLAGVAASGRILASESVYPATSFRVNPVLSLRTRDLIWFHHGAEEVYDLAADPNQRVDLSATPRGRALIAELTPKMAAQFGADPAAEIAARTLEASPEQVEALKSLGYAGTTGAGAGPLRREDIRLFLADLRSFNAARDRLHAGNAADARDALRALVARYPDATLIWRELGSACVAISDRAGAEEAFGRALALDPEDSVSSLNLGNLRAMSGDTAGAVRLYLRSLASEEDQSEAHLNIGLLYAQVLHRPSDASKHLRRFLELSPSDPQAPQVRALLAKLGAAPAAGRGKPAGARPAGAQPGGARHSGAQVDGP